MKFRKRVKLNKVGGGGRPLSIAPGYLRRTGGERGIGFLTTLVFGTLTAVIIVVGYHVIPFYYYYFEMENQMHSLIRVAGIHTDEQLREKLRIQMKRMEIPANIDDVKIRRFADKMSMSLDYEEEFYIYFLGEEYHIHTFEFEARAEGAY